jgi:uncharacterized repeat protein (TIGR01451 family)
MDRLARWLILMIVTCVALALTAVLIAAASPSTRNVRSAERQVESVAVLEPALAKALAVAPPDQRLDVIVELREQVDPASLDTGDTPDLGTRRLMISAMQATAERSQAELRAYLSARWLSGDVTRVFSFWIFNGLAVNGARPGVVRDLAAHPDVALIRLDHWRRWIDAAPDSSFVDHPSSVEWGIGRVRADQVWSTLGFSGTGVAVANLDSGVDWQHPALQANYRGYSPKGFHNHEGNWFDATGEGALYPVDGNGHGTHTMGTIVGHAGVGVAPGARWIAVRAFDTFGFGLDSWLHAGFQWLLAPDGEPDLAPQVVNNSWGNNLSTLTTFQRDIDALRAAGIFVLFSAGNAGPDRGTVGSPASLPGAFAVGASDQDDEVASFSSRGPSPWREIRPHVVAPGVNVNSTEPGGAYGIGQGTSMAAPHVAGTVALMLSARPDLTITQTAFILTSTAMPLGEAVPNDDAGYGRLDAYAAVALAANAGLISGTTYGAGVPLSHVTIRATPAISGLDGIAASDRAGRYKLFLGSGYYDLTASAFGYVTAYDHAVPVTTGVVTARDFDLVPLPTGRVQGTVTAAGGRKVDATLNVLGTPVTITATGGSYSLDLPSGSYTLQAHALGYRVVTARVTVTTGQSTYYDFVLPDAMRVLLLDSGQWYYQSQVSYYRQALDDLSYTYDELRLKHLPADTPTLTDLLPYDLVIWSAPGDSPGLVRAGNVITDYLGNGGNLLLSGQDVAYWDGGGIRSLQRYYTNFLHSVFRADNAPSRQVVCLDDSAFGGISLTIQGVGGADNQNWPDEIRVYQPDHASLACQYQGGQGAVIQAGFCNAHRALNLGFGFEGINDGADRADFMAHALDWFASPRQVAGVELMRKSDATQIAPPGDIVTHTFRLRNLGEVGVPDLIHIEIAGNEWETTILTRTAELSPCATTPIGLRVKIPGDVTWNAFDTVTMTARSSVDPALSQTLVLTSKVPAPVLLVDDDRWYDQEQAYEDALNAAGLPYDRWEVTGFFGGGSPPDEVLAWYPAVLWFTGYDWFDPLHSSELDRLTGYLDSGGRLFLSSQDALYYVGSSDLFRDYFGVITHSEVFSQTAVQGVPGHVLGDGLGPVELIYPFKNWSDSVLPSPGTQIAFRGQHGQPGALTREGACDVAPMACRWRTAFFGFPFEALPGETRTTLMPRLVGWLSWLGGSDLQSERALAQIGDTVDYTLTLRNDGPGTVFGAAVSNTLPAGTVLVDGPAGGAAYDAQNRRIAWTGDLDSGAAVTFTYRLSLTQGMAQVPLRNAADVLLGEQGLHFQRQADVRLAAPDLAASSLRVSPEDASHAPAPVGSSAELLVTLVLRNEGLADTPDATVDNPLPWPLRLVTGTLSSGGVGLATELPGENRVRWEGAVAIGAPVTVTYRAVAPSVLQDGIWLFNAAHLQDGMSGAWERGHWLYVQPYRQFFPFVTR